MDNNKSLEILQKHEAHKKKRAEYMKQYRLKNKEVNDDEYKKNNAEYMRQYRLKQKHLLQEAKDFINKEGNPPG